MVFPLPAATPSELGLDPRRLDRLCALVDEHIASGVHPGAQLAVARRGKLALFRSFGSARLSPAKPTTDDTLFLMFSNTKVVTASAIWMLVEDGKLRLDAPVATYLPGFERHGKGGITMLQLMTHQAGFPSATVPASAFEDHAALRECVCDFKPEWAAGSRVHYHPGSAHWVAAMVIEAITGSDFRDVIRTRITEPLGIDGEVKIGVKGEAVERCADMHAPDGKAPLADDNTSEWRAAGRPGGGGFATARGMAAFYQMLLQGGRLGGARVLSPRMIAYATRNFTGERIDLMNSHPPHRGIGPGLRGTTEFHRGQGALAHPGTFGHGGAGSSYCWGDPESGVSFAFLSNARLEEDKHDARMELLSNVVHASIVE